jgi:hypothetical protein
MSSLILNVQISKIIEEHELITQTEEKQEDVAANLENLKTHAKKEAKEYRKKSIDYTVDNVLLNVQNENENLYGLTQNKNSIIDNEYIKSDNRKRWSSSVPRENIAVDTNEDTQIKKRVSQYRARLSIKPKQFNHLTDWNKQNEKTLKTIIGNKKYLDRVMINNEKKRYENELKLIQKINAEKKDIFSKPVLSKYTQRIIKAKFNDDKPIYQRTKEVIEKRNQKIEELKKKVVEDPNDLVIPIKCGKYEKERYNKWVAEQVEWKNTLRAKNEDLKKNKERIETEAEKTLYKPTINKFSETIAKFKYTETPEKSIYDKLYDYKDKMNQTMIDLKRNLSPSFTPILNKPAKKGRVDTELNRSMIETKSNYDPILTKYTYTKESKRPKSQERIDTYAFVNHDKHWTRVITEVNEKENVKDNSSYLYKINVRGSSAWDQDHLNLVMLNNRTIELFTNK